MNSEDEQGTDSVLVGVTGEDAGTTRDAGAVVEMSFVHKGYVLGYKVRGSSFGSSAGRHTGERYGSVMAK